MKRLSAAMLAVFLLAGFYAWAAPVSPVQTKSCPSGQFFSELGTNSQFSCAGAAVPLAIGWVAGANPDKATITVVKQNSTVSAIVGVVDTAVGATATITVYKAPSGTACSSGTALHSGTFNANGTAVTNQTLTVTVASVAAEDRLCLSTAHGSAFEAGSGIGTITVFLSPS